MIFVCNNGSSSYPYGIPSKYIVIYPMELRILVLLKQTFVLSVFFLTRFHCTCKTFLIIISLKRSCSFGLFFGLSEVSSVLSEVSSVLSEVSSVLSEVEYEFSVE